MTDAPYRVFINGGTPIDGWLIMENPDMDNFGPPFEETSINLQMESIPSIPCVRQINIHNITVITRI